MPAACNASRLRSSLAPSATSARLQLGDVVDDRVDHQASVRLVQARLHLDVSKFPGREDMESFERTRALCADASSIAASAPWSGLRSVTCMRSIASRV